MSGARGQANHELYLARIMISCWREALAKEHEPAVALWQAFFPGTRAHLIKAYGWFLLEVSGVKALPEMPPGDCSELPEPEPGKAVPGEIQEFMQLERGGWLADMLAPVAVSASNEVRSRGNLASATAASHDPEAAQAWYEQLGQLFARMGDSLDEY